MFKSKFVRRTAIQSLGLICFSAISFSSVAAQTKRRLPVKKIAAPAAASKTVQPKPTLPAAKPAANLPKVTQIDEIGLKNLTKREGENAKPLLINFWATWCAPCLEEFPDLVKISNDYKEKLDTITVSFDDLAEINRDVPAFLGKMKAEMPAYLLKTQDEQTAIKMISEMWRGGLPFTILYDASGKTVYTRQGKFKTVDLRAQIDSVIAK